ncbi:MAG: type II toxin-antitoxin system VapC family toxin [Gallionella sp.]|nr:type II toxin-antitoxin system VapC family toxin [Gallionella sp.]
MIVLDTCAILWDALSPSLLSKKAATAITHADAGNSIIISDISLWEIAMLIRKGRLEIDVSAARFLQIFLQSRNVVVKAITPEIAELSVNLGAEVGNDPADRIIAATAMLNNASLVTADQRLIDCTLVDTLW